jgi:adenylylsulfate kinase-like enzyme
MIIHFIGQPGSGKSTLAGKIAKIVPNPMIIDGDEMRDIFKNKDYSEEGRRRNLTNAYNIARFLEAKGFTPIIAMVSPYLDLREELKATSNTVEIFLHTEDVRGRETFFVNDYEEPVNDYLSIDTTASELDCLRIIKAHLILRGCI